MAFIVNYEKGDSYRVSAYWTKPVNVNCIYDTQFLRDGSKMVVIKTYNPDSKCGGISQTIHLNKESAKELIGILKKELDI